MVANTSGSGFACARFGMPFPLTDVARNGREALNLLDLGRVERVEDVRPQLISPQREEPFERQARVE